MSSKERMARWKDLGFTWNLHIGSRCQRFSICVFVGVFLRYSLLPHSFRCCSNECRGDVVSLLLYRGRLPVGAAGTSAPPLQPWFFEQTRFLAGSGRNSMRWQRCLMEEDFEKSAMFAELVSVWNHDQNLISEFFLGVGKRCADVLSRCAECSRHILSDIWIHLMIASQKVLFIRDEQNAH